LELDDKLKRLMKELGSAINESLSESERISEVMGKIRSAGYDLFLVLEVTVGFNKSGEAERPRRGKSAARKAETQQFRLTTQDAEFLRELKISVDVDEETR
jgi:hypothetical protein